MQLVSISVSLVCFYLVVSFSDAPIACAVLPENSPLDEVEDDVLDSNMRLLNMLRIVARHADGDVGHS